MAAEVFDAARRMGTNAGGKGSGRCSAEILPSDVQQGNSGLLVPLALAVRKNPWPQPSAENPLSRV